MQAWYYEQFGGPEVMKLGDLPPAAASEAHVLVHVSAAGINPADHKLRSGSARTLPHAFPVIAGMDVAGTVAAVGAGVEGFDIGQRVFGYIGLPFMAEGGSWAELSAVNAASLAATPDDVSDEIAAALPCAGLTALLMADTLRIEQGDRVLVHSAAGGVGHVFTQLAVLRGATVVGTASPKNHAYLRSLGAEPVDYGNDLADLATVASSGFDAIADFYGGDALTRSALFAHPNARQASVAPPPGSKAPRIAVRPTSSGATYLASLVSEGSLRVRIADVVPFRSALEAVADLEAGAAIGKLVLQGPQRT